MCFMNISHIITTLFQYSLLPFGYFRSLTCIQHITNGGTLYVLPNEKFIIKHTERHGINIIKHTTQYTNGTMSIEHCKI